MRHATAAPTPVIDTRHHPPPPPLAWQVTLAEAVPVPGSGLTLPLNLRAIASKCNGCYYAPKRFAAVQLAFANPRARVLIFRTPQTRAHALQAFN